MTTAADRPELDATFALARRAARARRAAIARGDQEAAVKATLVFDHARLRLKLLGEDRLTR